MLHAVRQHVGLLSGVVFAAALVLALIVPVRAEDTAHVTKAKRTPTSFESLPGTSVGASATHAVFTGGLLYFPAPMTGLNVGGRLNVGKSHVYVPYYGNVSNDPVHPGVQGTAGIAYGLHNWDISVYNSAIGTQPQPTVPGAEAPKVNPAVSFSIRF